MIYKRALQSLNKRSTIQTFDYGDRQLKIVFLNQYIVFMANLINNKFYLIIDFCSYYLLHDCGGLREPYLKLPKQFDTRRMR